MKMRVRPTRATLNKILAIGGILIVFVQMLFIAYTRSQVIVIWGGIILNQIGVWGIVSDLLPDRRVYKQLRSEGEGFLALIRRLNAAAVRDDDIEIEATRAAMLDAVHRMVDVAGVPDRGHVPGGSEGHSGARA